MKNRIFALLVMILAATHPAFAAFPVKHNTSEEKKRQTNTLYKTTPVLVQAYDKAATTSSNFARIFQVSNTSLPEKHKGNGLGITSMVFGILGVAGAATVIFGLLFSLVAITVGAAGLHQHQKFSLTGLILGISGFILSLILLLIIIA